jgi:hypothetical protein
MQRRTEPPAAIPATSPGVSGNVELVRARGLMGGFGLRPSGPGGGLLLPSFPGPGMKVR